MPAYFDDRQAARISGLSPESFRHFRFVGLRGEGPGKAWSDRQVLGLAVKSQSRRAGATKEASTRAFEILATADLDGIRKAVAGGHRFLRLFDKVCDTNTVMQMGHASFSTTQEYIKYAKEHENAAYNFHLPAGMKARLDALEADRKADDSQSGGQVADTAKNPTQTKKASKA